jgi:serine/threonine-protein kinase
MSPERYTKIRALFEQALEEAKERRVDFVRAAAGDQEIEEAVLRLLDADAANAPALDAPEHLDTVPISTASILSTPYPPGYVPGHYTILKLLGFGGMGAVYLASRNDQAFTTSGVRPCRTPSGIQERVALALLNPKSVVQSLKMPMGVACGRNSTHWRINR